MRYILLVLGWILLASQPQNGQPIAASDSDTSSFVFVRYPEEELWTFLDSVGHADLTATIASLNTLVDSTLYHQTTLHKTLRKADFKKLKLQLEEGGAVELDLALRIFPLLEVDSSLLIAEEKYKLPVVYIPFKNDSDELEAFAVAIGYKGFWRNDVYFFKGNKIIARHAIFHRYGLDLNFFKNEQQELIVYYKVNYGSGTGIWWHQYNFYRFGKDRLYPVLTEIQNINLQFPWSIRAYWIEAKVANERPLQIKFEYNNQFYDTLAIYPDFINDSSIVTYAINPRTGLYEADFSNTLLNRNKLLSYFHADNELLFIQAHYEQLVALLKGEDEAMKQAIFLYLTSLKNMLEEAKQTR